MARQDAVEDAAMPISPIHHGRNGEQSPARRLRVLSSVHNLEFSVMGSGAQLENVKTLIRMAGFQPIPGQQSWAEIYATT